MTMLVESHEITNILNMDVESEEDEYFEDEEYAAHGQNPPINQISSMMDTNLIQS